MDSRKRTEDMVLDVVKDVKVIKAAILKSRYIAARRANGEMLKLYFAIGGYVSQNSRNGRWGSGVIDEISRLLQKELPGLRGTLQLMVARAVATEVAMVAIHLRTATTSLRRIIRYLLPHW